MASSSINACCCSCGGQKSRSRVSQGRTSSRGTVGESMSFPFWLLLWPLASSAFVLRGYMSWYLWPIWKVQDELLLSRFSTESHPLPSNIIFTGSGDSEVGTSLGQQWFCPSQSVSRRTRRDAGACLILKPLGATHLWELRS